ncbi:MAG: hypothetical protein QY318_01745 [Candidatus Dojkabacteria bacterium]|nr:MAG: hypothetical protein QY318_01745 [Candidatus Dojkabacteria bacterium]
MISQEFGLQKLAEVPFRSVRAYMSVAGFTEEVRFTPDDSLTAIALDILSVYFLLYGRNGSFSPMPIDSALNQHYSIVSNPIISEPADFINTPYTDKIDNPHHNAEGISLRSVTIPLNPALRQGTRIYLEPNIDQEVFTIYKMVSKNTPEG